MSNNNNVLIEQNGNQQQKTQHIIPIDNFDSLPPTNRPILTRSISQKPNVDVIQEEYSGDVDNLDVKIRIKSTYERNDDSDIYTINRNQSEGHVNDGCDVNNASIDESYSSLPIISEQYCCCKSWAGLECTLLKAVGILVVIIVVVAIIGSIVKYTRQDDDTIPTDRNKFTWSL